MLNDTQFLKDCASALGFNLSDKQIWQFSSYFNAVIESNKTFNLTAITDEKDFIIKHFSDSLAGVSEIPKNATICDIGAGAGFPSVPIAIVREDVNVVALDSTAKKMAFVLKSAKEIELNNISTISGRAEEQFAKFGTFDAVCARAVSALPILLELAMPLLKIDGIFIAYKTDNNELVGIENALSTLHAKLINTKLLTLANGDRRAIMTFQKMAKTPPQYPRQYGTIKKKPL